MAVEVYGEYVGELRCAMMHGPSGSRLLTEAPADNGGKGESFSPTDLVATALGSCMMTTMALVAEREKIDMKGATVRVEKHMGTDPRRIVKLPVSFKLPAALTPEQRTKLENAARACPVHRSLHGEMESPVVFEYA